VRETFARELAGLPATDQKEVADALAAAVSWEMWDGLRTGQGQSVAAAKRVVRRLVAGLIA
jgi:hypothetical protein